jgi:hypothetical protein
MKCSLLRFAYRLIFIQLRKTRERQPYLLLPILNILVPQVGHTPWVAGRPFFIVISLVSFISLFALHFTQ